MNVNSHHAQQNMNIVTDLMNDFLIYLITHLKITKINQFLNEYYILCIERTHVTETTMGNQVSTTIFSLEITLFKWCPVFSLNRLSQSPLVTLSFSGKDSV